MPVQQNLATMILFTKLDPPYKRFTEIVKLEGRAAIMWFSELI